MHPHPSTSVHMHPHPFTSVHMHSHQSTFIHMNQHPFACFHIHPHASTYIWFNPHSSTCIHTHSHPSTCIHISPHSSTCINTNTHTFISIHIHPHASTPTFIHPHASTPIHIHSHSSTWINTQPKLTSMAVGQHLFNVRFHLCVMRILEYTFMLTHFNANILWAAIKNAICRRRMIWALEQRDQILNGPSKDRFSVALYWLLDSYHCHKISRTTPRLRQSAGDRMSGTFTWAKNTAIEIYGPCPVGCPQLLLFRSQVDVL